LPGLQAQISHSSSINGARRYEDGALPNRAILAKGDSYVRE
jgi:hypothetical protein